MTSFAPKPTNQDLERTCEAFYAGGSIGNLGRDGVRFLDIHQHDACNHTLIGTIDIEGVIHGFIIHDGNNAGTEVESWGDPEDVGYY